MKDYISVNDGSFFGKNDSETIQNAITAACKDGCRAILIPRYNARTDSTVWRIGVSIKLPDNFTVYLDNCYMVQETGYFDNMFTNVCSHDGTKRDIKYEQKNIAVIGIGNVVLDGGKHNHLREKNTRRFGLPTLYNNNMFLWVNVNGLRVENINIQHQRWWAINHVYCRNVKIKNIHFYAIPHINNMDGIDLRVGNNNFVIENITGKTGDDVVALTALGGRLEAEYGISGKDGDIHDIKIRNVKADPTTCFCVRLLNHDGNKEYNIDIDTVMDTSDYLSKKRIGAALILGSPIYYARSRMQIGDFYNINVKNITTRGTDAVLFNLALEHSKISNVHVFGDGQNMISPGRGGNVNPLTSPQAECYFNDVTFEHLYHGSVQDDMIDGRMLPAENYRGYVFGLVNCRGEIDIKDVHIDKAYLAFKVDGGLKVNVEGYKCNRVYKEFDVAPDSTVAINGKGL